MRDLRTATRDYERWVRRYTRLLPADLRLKHVNLTGGSSSKGISVYQVSNSTFTNVTATTGNFFIEPGSWGDTFTSCVPTPTPH